MNIINYDMKKIDMRIMIISSEIILCDVYL